jgi:hypothetical protein
LKLVQRADKEDYLPSSPFAVQELIDYCLDFLHASVPDLKRCALVSRHWTNTCQKHLFSHIIINSPGFLYEYSFFVIERRWHPLCEVLSTSPRLLGLVKSLQIHLDKIPPDTLTSFANLSFPSLRRIIVSGNWMPEELFSLGTLSAISLSGTFESLSEFIRVLTRCSTSITDVSFHNVRIRRRLNGLPSSIPHPSNRTIEVNALDLWGSPDIHDWLNSAECLFDFSNLRRLRLNDNTCASLPHWAAFAPAIPRVEHLQFQPQITVRTLHSNP